VSVIRAINSLDPGGDGEWFTSDDVVYNYDTTDYDSLGRKSRLYTWNDGTDGKWFTGDDEVTGHRIYAHDSNGSLLGVYYYYGVYYHY
jgi:hypothetical protein